MSRQTSTNTHGHRAGGGGANGRGKLGDGEVFSMFNNREELGHEDGSRVVVFARLHAEHAAKQHLSHLTHK